MSVGGCASHAAALTESWAVRRRHWPGRKMKAPVFECLNAAFILAVGAVPGRSPSCTRLFAVTCRHRTQSAWTSHSVCRGARACRSDTATLQASHPTVALFSSAIARGVFARAGPKARRGSSLLAWRSGLALRRRGRNLCGASVC